MRTRFPLMLGLALLLPPAGSVAIPVENSMTPLPDGDVVRIDRSGKGAVLCAWGIFEAIRAVGRECHRGEDAAFQKELKQSLRRIDGFIMRNSKQPVTAIDLAARRSQGLRQLRSSGNICRGQAEHMYDVLRSRGAGVLRAETTDLLSLPREPVMNPCL